MQVASNSDERQSPSAGPEQFTFDGPLALALSGGGFRAAGFHLGVLSVLHRTGLLPEARVLSTASGGSLVGARLMLGMVRGESFEQTYHRIHSYLTTQRPLEAALSKAARERITLTQAFAAHLNETLFHDSSRSAATMREIYDARICFTEGSINATAIRTGRSFRFSFSRGEHARVGHQNAHLPRKVAEHLRLADVVAASCAFPGAFEPLVLPHDFVWPDQTSRSAALDALKGDAHGLVDGGVHDNQAIDPMLLATERLTQTVGMFMVSDADRGLEGAEPRAVNAKTSQKPRPSVRVAHLSWLSYGLCALSLVTATLLVMKARAEVAINDFRLPTDAIAYGVPLAFCAATIGAVVYARSRLKRAVKPLLPHAGRSFWKSVKRMRVADVLAAVQTRVRTLESLASSSFPRRLRGLVYRGAWSDSRLLERRVAVQITTLATDRFSLIENLYSPSFAITSAAELAGSLPTALQLDSTEEIDALVVTGQATAIGKIMEVLELRHGADRELWPDRARSVGHVLARDWDTLNGTGRPLRPNAT